MSAPRWFDDETTALMGERARVRRLERRPAPDLSAAVPTVSWAYGSSSTATGAITTPTVDVYELTSAMTTDTDSFTFDATDGRIGIKKPGQYLATTSLDVDYTTFTNRAWATVTLVFSLFATPGSTYGATVASPAINVPFAADGNGDMGTSTAQQFWSFLIDESTIDPLNSATWAYLRPQYAVEISSPDSLALDFAAVSILRVADTTAVSFTSL